MYSMVVIPNKYKGGDTMTIVADRQILDCSQCDYKELNPEVCRMCKLADYDIPFDRKLNRDSKLIFPKVQNVSFK